LVVRSLLALVVRSLLAVRSLGLISCPTRGLLIVVVVLVFVAVSRVDVFLKESRFKLLGVI
jgi:hypothetical protein